MLLHYLLPWGKLTGSSSSSSSRGKCGGILSINKKNTVGGGRYRRAVRRGVWRYFQTSKRPPLPGEKCTFLPGNSWANCCARTIIILSEVQWTSRNTWSDPTQFVLFFAPEMRRKLIFSSAGPGPSGSTPTRLPGHHQEACHIESRRESSLGDFLRRPHARS